MLRNDTKCKYRKTSNIRWTLVGNKIVDHSDVVGASPVGSNYIFFLGLIPGFNGLGKDKCKTRQQMFKDKSLEFGAAYIRDLTVYLYSTANRFNITRVKCPLPFLWSHWRAIGSAPQWWQKRVGYPGHQRRRKGWSQSRCHRRTWPWPGIICRECSAVINGGNE